MEYVPAEMKTVTGNLRRALENCGQTRYEVSQATGIPQSTLSRFVNGKDPSGATIDRLAKYLGLALSPQRRGAKRGEGR